AWYRGLLQQCASSSIFGKFQSISARIDDIHRVAGAFAVDARLIHLDSFGLKLLDQFLWIVRSFDVKGVMRHLRRPFLRSIEQTEAGFTGAQAIDFDAGDGVLGTEISA